MSKLLIVIFLIIIFFVVKVCVSLIRGSIKIFKAGGNTNRDNSGQNNKYYDTDNLGSDHQKQFSKNEGKYVDYEEVVEESREK